MVNVGQTVPNGNAGVLGEIFHHALLVAAVLNAVIEASENLGGIFERFLLAHLRGLGIEEGDVRAFVEAGDLECAAGTGRRLFKEKNDVLALEHFVVDAGALLGLEVMRKIQHVADFLRGEIHEG